MKNMHCVQRKAAWIFSRESVKYKIDASGENPTSCQLHWCSSQWLHGYGAKSDVISVNCTPPCPFFQSQGCSYIHLTSMLAGDCLLLFFSEA